MSAAPYFLYGYFGAGNFGDDALLRSAVENILQQDPDARFWVRSYGAELPLAEFGERVECADIESVHDKNWPLPVKFLALLGRYWTYMGRCRALVVGGGTLIHDRPYLKSTFLLFCLCLIARLRGRPVVGIGLGTKVIQSWWGKRFLRWIIAVSTRVCLRDRQSYAICQELARRPDKLSLTTDLAYALSWDEERKGTSKGNKTIAVSLVDYMFEAQSTAQLDLLAAILEEWSKKGYALRLLSLQKALNGGGDTALLESLRQRLSPAAQSSCSIVPLEASPEALQSAYKDVALVVGMRFHSLVFAAIYGIPFVGLAHEPKIEAICAEFQMPCQPLQGMTKQGLQKALEAGVKAEVSAGQVQNFRALAHKNFAALAAAIK